MIAQALNDRLPNFSICTQDCEIRLGTYFEPALMIESRRPRRIQRRSAHGIFQAPVRELSHIAHGAIHGEHASGKTAAAGALSILDFDLDWSELVASVGHAGRGDGIGDQHGAVGALGLHKKLNDRRCNVNAVGNDVGTEPVVGKHLGDDAGIAMIERTHGIECVSRMTRPCLDCTLGDRQLGIGVRLRRLAASLTTLMAARLEASQVHEVK